MKRLVTIRRITFHHSLSYFGDADLINNWHIARGFKEIGYHFVIKKSGEIQKGRSMKYQGAHASGKNYDSIGVCFIGDFNKYDIKRLQLNSAIRLVYYLQSISKSIYIDFHCDNKKKVCPGKKFNREYFVKRITKVCPLIEYNKKCKYIWWS